jgi:hypothetical protein
MLACGGGETPSADDGPPADDTNLADDLISLPDPGTLPDQGSADDPGPLPEPDTQPPSDTTPPTWADDAQLIAVAGVDEVYLNWPAATDDEEGVVAYRVFSDGTQIAELEGLEYIASDLEPETDYVFTIQAGDEAGNWTTDGLSATVTTARDHDPGFKRLTQAQYNRTLADLHGTVWEAEWAKTTPSPSWLRDVDTWYEMFTIQGWGYWGNYHNAYPADVQTNGTEEPRGGYKRLDQVVYDEHVAVWVGSTMQVAGYDYEGWVGGLIVFGACDQDNDDGITNFATQEEINENCVSNYITTFGKLAFRRPLSAEEHQFFMDTYLEVSALYADQNLNIQETASRGLRNVIAVINNSPEFLYRVEIGDENGDLTAWELASRLSFHFWNTMPDEELFAAAEDGSLLTDAGYAAQVERLANDPRTRRVVDEFYRDYFRVQNIPNIHQQDGPAQYHGGPQYNIYGNAINYIQVAMMDELANLGKWFTLDQPGTYEEMFRSNLHFLGCQYPAWVPDQCYGAGPYSQFTYGIGGCDGTDVCFGGGWDGVSSPITLPESERAGLLTRLALLGHDTIYTRPIRRGLYIREALLCDPIPPPESCDVVKPPEIIPGMTVREQVEAVTEVPNTSCAGCHGTLINGFGHTLNHFSSKGQYWETEHMFTDQTNGDGDYWYFLADEDQWAPIDATGTTYFDGGMVTVNGAHELTDVLATSGKLEACWSREYFRFSIGRAEWDVDQESIDGLTSQLVGGASLDDAFKEIAYLPQFKTLYKAPEIPEVTP